MTEESGFDSWHGQQVALLSITSRLAQGPTQPPIQWVPRAVSRGGGREADRSPPCSVEINNGGAILLFPHTSSWHDA
jgi:hypothetical protein